MCAPTGGVLVQQSSIQAVVGPATGVCQAHGGGDLEHTSAEGALGHGGWPGQLHTANQPASKFCR